MLSSIDTIIIVVDINSTNPNKNHNRRQFLTSIAKKTALATAATATSFGPLALTSQNDETKTGLDEKRIETQAYIERTFPKEDAELIKSRIKVLLNPNLTHALAKVPGHFAKYRKNIQEQIDKQQFIPKDPKTGKTLAEEKTLEEWATPNFLETSCDMWAKANLGPIFFLFSAGLRTGFDAINNDQLKIPGIAKEDQGQALTAINYHLETLLNSSSFYRFNKILKEAYKRIMQRDIAGDNLYNGDVRKVPSKEVIKELQNVKKAFQKSGSHLASAFINGPKNMLRTPQGAIDVLLIALSIPLTIKTNSAVGRLPSMIHRAGVFTRKARHAVMPAKSEEDNAVNEAFADNTMGFATLALNGWVQHIVGSKIHQMKISNDPVINDYIRELYGAINATFNYSALNETGIYGATRELVAGNIHKVEKDETESFMQAAKRIAFNGSVSLAEATLKPAANAFELFTKPALNLGDLKQILRILDKKITNPNERILMIFDFDGVLKNDDSQAMSDDLKIPEQISDQLAGLDQSGKFKAKILTARSPGTFTGTDLFHDIDKYCCDGKSKLTGKANISFSDALYSRFWSEAQSYKKRLLKDLFINQLYEQEKISVYEGSGALGISIHKDYPKDEVSKLKEKIVEAMQRDKPKGWVRTMDFDEREPRNIFFSSPESYPDTGYQGKLIGFRRIIDDLEAEGNFKPTTIINFGDTISDIRFMEAASEDTRTKNLDIINVQVSNKLDGHDEIKIKLDDHYDVYKLIHQLDRKRKEGSFVLAA